MVVVEKPEHLLVARTNADFMELFSKVNITGVIKAQWLRRMQYACRRTEYLKQRLKGISGKGVH